MVDYETTSPNIHLGVQHVGISLTCWQTYAQFMIVVKQVVKQHALGLHLTAQLCSDLFTRGYYAKSQLNMHFVWV